MDTTEEEARIKLMWTAQHKYTNIFHFTFDEERPSEREYENQKQWVGKAEYDDVYNALVIADSMIQDFEKKVASSNKYSMVDRALKKHYLAGFWGRAMARTWDKVKALEELLRDSRSFISTLAASATNRGTQRMAIAEGQRIGKALDSIDEIRKAENIDKGGT